MMEAADILARSGRAWAFDAFVVAARFDAAGERFAFALGDGAVRLGAVEAGPAEPEAVPAHDGAVLAMDLDCDGAGFLSGGDDGRVVALRAGAEPQVVADLGRRWVEHVACHAGSGLRAVADGKVVRLYRRDGGEVGRTPPHRSTVSGIAFNPKGRRLAVSHYDGVTLWWTAGLDQQPKTLTWHGSHLGVTWSPDGRYLVTATQENELHGWRLSDGLDMRMSGFPSKVKSMSWSSSGAWLATSGADAPTCWRFSGDGPMGKAPVELGWSGGSVVTCVAFHPKRDLVAAGFEDGAVVLGEVATRQVMGIRRPDGSAVSALAWAPRGRYLAAGTEDGHAVVLDFAAGAGG